MIERNKKSAKNHVRDKTRKFLRRIKDVAKFEPTEGHQLKDISETIYKKMPNLEHLTKQNKTAMAQQTSPARVLGSRRGSTVPAQATDDDLHAAAAVPHAAGAGPAGRPRDAAGVRAARGGGAAASFSNAQRVVGLGAEAPRGRGGLAPRLTIPLPPYPRNYGHNK